MIFDFQNISPLLISFALLLEVAQSISHEKIIFIY
jgi:hypothetical protein